jgi:hypothetical protein
LAGLCGDHLLWHRMTMFHQSVFLWSNEKEI